MWVVSVSRDDRTDAPLFTQAIDSAGVQTAIVSLVAAEINVLALERLFQYELANLIKLIVRGSIV